ncbi:hypothetical protein [Undibacterium parvum]|uniref:Uncharacterized protein n=2 Tax=Undibacterium TaxID=401469 RepID=A0A6M4A357_9BURK|nr:hypothetical protein [Undibacterium parvum]AZP11084.1 hypothetical protein EJN92_03085 [Undibacterium parvum]QJQ05624.1 hypothetical protein EJG51_006900 [Undibacterium piscinae]
MTYAQIDPIIDAWVAKHNFSLFTHTEGVVDSDFRAVYLSSKHGECCQIWIDKPESGMLSLHAVDIETRQNEEMRRDWSVPISELGGALDEAVTYVRKWFDR